MKKIISEKITLALEFCAEAHKEQVRKGNGTPYASHPSSVGFILLSSGYDEDVAVAGILHDIIEDTKYTKDDIEKRFGKKVLEMVLGVTEDKSIKNWQERKDKYLEKVAKSNKYIKAISASDMLDNYRSMVRETKNSEDFWKEFHADKEKIISFYKKRFDIVKKDISPTLKKEVQKILNQIK